MFCGNCRNSTAAHVALRKIAVSLADSQDLRVILSVLYTITEVMRAEKASGSSEYQEQIQSFYNEIGIPLILFTKNLNLFIFVVLVNPVGEDLLVIKLLSMVTRFCSGVAPHFPMKKVLLLLWKLLLVSLGGMNTLKELKAEKRRIAGLAPQDEDTMEVARTMRASSPPASASDLLDAQNQKRNNRPLRRVNGFVHNYQLLLLISSLQSLMKQSSLDDHESMGMELGVMVGNDNTDEIELSEFDERRPANVANENNQMYNNFQNRPQSPEPAPMPVPRGTKTETYKLLQLTAVISGLPWKPKVRQKDIDMFLENARLKFVGYNLPGDRVTLAGLPQPIHESVKTLKDVKSS